ncbi:MAG: FAS1-like dehydratase domain-containing protein [Promethearchaeota archaeon]
MVESSITGVNLFKILTKINKEFRQKKVNINEGEIQTFCEIIDDRNPLYFNNSVASQLGLEGKIIPPGYLMSLTNKFIQDIFIKFGPLLFNKIKGVVHVCSEVEYLKPLLIGEKYLIKIEFDKPVKKVGRKGTSFNVNFKTSIIDFNGVVHAVDNHYFFFKIRKEGEFKSNES